MTDTADTAATDALELADRFFRAVEEGDIDALRDIYAPDAVVWHNNDQVEQAVEENLVTLAWIARNLPERAYTDIQRDAVPGGFVQQHVLRARTKWGVDLVLPAMMRVWCENGRITRLDEYFDSAQLAVLNRRD